MNCVIQLHVLDGQPNQANDQIQTTTQVARSFALLQPLVDQGAPLHLNVGTRQEARLVKTLIEAAGRHGHNRFLADAFGTPLPRPTIINLAELAAGLGFRGGAIEEIVAHLAQGVTNFDSAVTFYDQLPPALASHPSARVARGKALQYLPPTIVELNSQVGQDQQQWGRLRRGRDALALCLGPVSSFFLPEMGGRANSAGGFKKYTLPLLRGDIKHLPMVAMWHLMASERLQVETEAEVYLLAACWAAQSTYGTTTSSPGDAFHAVMDQVRWQHLSLDYVANFVAHCPYIRKCGGPALASVMTAALVHRDACPALLTRHNVTTAAPNRGKPLSRASWLLRTGIQVEEVEGLANAGASVRKVIGQANGYPLELCIKHTQDEQSGDESLGLYLHALFPHSTSIGDGADKSRQVGNGLERGVGLEVSISLTGKAAPMRFRAFLAEDKGWGFPAAIPWGLAAYGTQHFPTGRCEVELTVSMATA